MVVFNDEFIERLKPYVAEYLSVRSEKLFVDFRSLYFGEIDEIGVLALPDYTTLVSTTDKINEVIKLDSEIGHNVFTSEFGSIYFFLGFVGDDTRFVIDDTFEMTLSAKSSGATNGFFFNRLSCKADLNRRVYALRFRRTV